MFLAVFNFKYHFPMKRAFCFIDGFDCFILVIKEVVHLNGQLLTDIFDERKDDSFRFPVDGGQQLQKRGNRVIEFDQ